ncbi:hypothetical protein D1007_40178 [Hordeum vulgare]|nr:hypothetical protein D1007_40178 [Hordeum vulgare]
MDGGGGGVAYRCKARIEKHQHLKIALLPIPGELPMDIFIHLPMLEDLLLVPAACLSFHNIVADHSFLRRFCKVHTPPLLVFLDDHREFHTGIPPHPSAPAASAVVVAADFSFLPHLTHSWVIKDIRGDRVLLLTTGEKWRLVREMVVCDPLHRLYLLLPPTPEDLVASMEDPHWIEGTCGCETFPLPPNINNEEAETAEETTF